MLPDGSGLIDLHVGWLPGTEYWCGGTYSYHGFHMYRLVASGTGVVVLWLRGLGFLLGCLRVASSLNLKLAINS